jgi:ribosomal-protein-alanine N-acetyltransferase
VEECSSAAPWPRELIKRDLSGETPYLYLGAWGKDVLLGFAVLGPGERGAEIANIAVVPEHRRRGVGSQLVAAVCEVAFVLGHSKIGLHVRMSHYEARLFYKKLGFIPSFVVRKYYAPPEFRSPLEKDGKGSVESEDALVMEAGLPLCIP